MTRPPRIKTSWPIVGLTSSLFNCPGIYAFVLNCTGSSPNFFGRHQPTRTYLLLAEFGFRGVIIWTSDLFFNNRAFTFVNGLPCNKKCLFRRFHLGRFFFNNWAIVVKGLLSAWLFDSRNHPEIWFFFNLHTGQFKAFFVNRPCPTC